MIQIQIAGALSEDGVGDVRWVLLDASDVPERATASAVASAAPLPGRGAEAMPVARGGPSVPSEQPAMAANLGGSSAVVAAAPGGRPARQPAKDHDEAHQAAMAYQVLRAVVLVAALTAAWWTAASLLDGRSAPVGSPQTTIRSSP